MAKKKKSFIKSQAAWAGVTSPIYILGQYNKGNLTGREKLYHVTDAKNIKSILEKGILKSRAGEAGTISRVLKHIDPKKLKNKVYLAKGRLGAASINPLDDPSGLGIIPTYLGINKNRKILKASVPVWSLKKHIVDNPELLGAKNFKEYFKSVKKINSGASSQMPKDIEKIIYKSNYNVIGPKGTVVLNKSLNPKFIKGSEKYKKLGLREFKEFVKRNKLRFSKGAGISAASLLATYLGAKYLLANRKAKK